jgi:hypothetical protein
MRSKWVAAAVLAAGLAVGPWAAPAQAQPPGHNVETIECEGLGTIDISVQRSDNFGAVQIVGTTGHLIPVAFTFTLENLTDDTVLFSETEAKNGHRNQATTPCSLTFTGTWEEVGEPGEEPPPGVDPDDILQFTLTADVIAKV